MKKFIYKTKIQGKNISKNLNFKKKFNTKNLMKKLLLKTKKELSNIVKSKNLIDIRTPSFLNAKFVF